MSFEKSFVILTEIWYAGLINDLKLKNTILFLKSTTQWSFGIKLCVSFKNIDFKL